MGCGKSSVGKELSKLLSWHFIDLDQAVETHTGRKIPEIFSSDGEAAFRRMELEVLKSVLAEPGNIILALGGGTVTTPECAAIIRQNTLCIYMRATADTLKDRLAGQTDGRPLLQGEELDIRLSRLMAMRSHIYEKTAHIIIDTDGKTISEIAQEIIISSHHVR